MWRSFLCLVSVGGVVTTTAGCTDQGSYQIAWQFAGGEPAQTGCGAHGVDSVRVIGSNTAGDTENVAAVCALSLDDKGQPMPFTHSVPVGTWTLAVHQVDVRGVEITPYMLDAQGQVILDPNTYQPISVPDPTATGDVPKNASSAPLYPPIVELAPRSQCRDGVDNDGDGRIDLDDPDCAGDPNGSRECTTGSPGC